MDCVAIYDSFKETLAAHRSHKKMVGETMQGLAARIAEHEAQSPSGWAGKLAYMFKDAVEIGGYRSRLKKSRKEDSKLDADIRQLAERTLDSLGRAELEKRPATDAERAAVMTLSKLRATADWIDEGLGMAHQACVSANAAQVMDAATKGRGVQMMALASLASAQSIAAEMAGHLQQFSDDCTAAGVTLKAVAIETYGFLDTLMMDMLGGLSGYADFGSFMAIHSLGETMNELSRAGAAVRDLSSRLAGQEKRIVGNVLDTAAAQDAPLAARVADVRQWLAPATVAGPSSAAPKTP